MTKLTAEEQRAYRAARPGLASSYQAKYEANNPGYVVCKNARRRAIADGIPYELVAKDILIPDVCPVLGIPIKKGEGVSSDNSPSLDKMKLALGYVPDNVRVISSRANRIKSDATIEELEAIIRYMRGEV